MPNRMAEATGPWNTLALLSEVRLTDDPALASELAVRLPAPSEPRTLSVSDLLAPRRAFWRRLRGPAPLPVERELQLERGRGWHRRLGDALAAEGTLEVRVRRGGLSGRIDLLGELPVELKTGAPPPGGGPPEDWPDQVEQLAAYCMLVGSPAGRLAHAVVPEAGPPTVTVGDLRFRDLDVIRSELARREEALRSALRAERPDPLARCRWFDLGCEYRAAGICSCRGDEPRELSTILDQLDHRVPRPELAAQWTAAVAASRPSQVWAPPHFRDVVYPRRAYFDRAGGRPPMPVPPRPRAAGLDGYERASAALEQGPVGEVHRLPTLAGAPDEEVLAWRGRPCLLRSSRVRPRLTADEVRGRFPQYLLDVGFRCALTGTHEGTVVVAYEASPPEELPIQVFRVELASGSRPFAEAWRARCAAVESALSRGVPSDLPSCPGWMATSCPHRAVCACAAEGSRSQR